MCSLFGQGSGVPRAGPRRTELSTTGQTRHTENNHKARGWGGGLTKDHGRYLEYFLNPVPVLILGDTVRTGGGFLER